MADGKNLKIDYITNKIITSSTVWRPFRFTCGASNPGR